MIFSKIKTILIALVSCAPIWLAAQGDAHDAGRSNGLSMNWYQMPYQLNSSQHVKVHGGNVRHQNGHNGVDINSFPDTYDDSNDPCDDNDFDAGLTVTAAADGTVRRVVDTNCCRNTADTCMSPVTYTINCIWVEHDNGEWSAYYHIAQGTAAVSEGQPVSAGDPLGLEGEVGPASGVHLHFALYYGYDGVTPKNMVTPGAFQGQRIPLVCGKIKDHFFVQRDRFEDDSNYDPAEHADFFSKNDGVIGDCSLIQPEDTDLAISGLTIDEVQVEKAITSITASDVTINPPQFGGACSSNDDCTSPNFCASGQCRNNGGSVVYSAGNHVTLGQGFRAKAGSYFRAEIGNYVTPQFAPNSTGKAYQERKAREKQSFDRNREQGHACTEHGD